MNKLTVDGMVWGYAYMLTDSRLSVEERDTFLVHAIRMFYTDQNKKKIKTENFEGYVRMTNPCALVGTHIGREYTGEMESNHLDHKATLKVIVSDQTSRPETSRN